MITDPAFIAGTPDVFVYGGRTVFQEGQDWKRSGYGVGCAPDINVNDDKKRFAARNASMKMCVG